MFLLKKYKNFLLFYIFLVGFLTIYYLLGVNAVLTYNAMSEWVINYQGGFVRRGFLGEIVFQISLFLKLNLRFSFLILQSFLYVYYYYLIYNLFKNIKLNYLILLAIFSPIFIFFPLAELEAIGRKEILIFLLLIIILNLYFKYQKNNLILFTISITYPFLLLVFEASIFYSLFFIYLILITSEKLDLAYFINLLFLSLPTIIVILAIIYNPHLPEQTDKMCDALKKIGENCGLASYFLSKTVNFHMLEVNWKFEHIIRYILIFIFGFGSLIILAFNSNYNVKKVNEIFLKIPFVYHLIVLILPTLIMFVIAVDTGRWTHMTYSCSIIFYFGLIKNKIIFLNYDSNFIKFIDSKLNNFFKILIFLILCLSWNPKAVYKEDIGTIPIYRAIEKMPNFYNNIFNIKVFIEKQ